MMRINRRRSLKAMTAFAAGALCSRVPFGQDLKEPSAVSKTGWTSFRNGPLQRGIATCEFTKQPKQKWKFACKDGWIATPAVVDNHVYAPALDGYLYCLERETGKVAWKYRSIEDPDPNTFAAGFKAAPLVTQDFVYVGDEDGFLHAVDRQSGQGKWKYETRAEIAGGVAEFEGRLLLASHDAFLYCLNTDGSERWKFETNDRINCSPAVANGYTFVSGCDKELRVINLNGGDEQRAVQMVSYLVASPAIVDDILYVGDHGGSVNAVNWQTGETVWVYQGDRQLAYHASAAVTEDLVIVGSHDKNLHAINRKTGAGVWRFPTKARIESSAVVVDERAIFGSGDRNVYGVNLKTGQETFRLNVGKPVNCGMALGEGCLVFGEDDAKGNLYCYA